MRETSWSVAHATTNGTPMNGDIAIFKNNFTVYTRAWNLKKGRGLNMNIMSIPHTIKAKYCEGKETAIRSPKLRAQSENNMANRVDRKPAILNTAVDVE